MQQRRLPSNPVPYILLFSSLVMLAGIFVVFMIVDRLGHDFAGPEIIHLILTIAFASILAGLALLFTAFVTVHYALERRRASARPRVGPDGSGHPQMRLLPRPAARAANYSGVTASQTVDRRPRRISSGGGRA